MRKRKPNDEVKILILQSLSYGDNLSKESLIQRTKSNKDAINLAIEYLVYTKAVNETTEPHGLRKYFKYSITPHGEDILINIGKMKSRQEKQPITHMSVEKQTDDSHGLITVGKVGRLYMIMEGSKEVGVEVLERCKTDLDELLAAYHQHYINKDLTLQKAVLKRIIRKIKESKANLDELPEFRDILSDLETEAFD